MWLYEHHCMIKNHISYHICIVFMIAAIVSGCGFHLRGSFLIPVHLQKLFVTPDNLYEPLQRTIRRQLKQKGVLIIPQTKPNVLTLTLTEPQFSERILAYGSCGQSQCLQLQLTFKYQVDCGQKILRRLTLIRISRDFTTSFNMVLSTNNEKSQIHSELLHEAASQLIRQLITVLLPKTT